MNKRISYLIYAWGTTVVYIAGIFWLAQVPYFSESIGEHALLVTLTYRILLYGVLFLMIYRSLLATLRFSVERLSKWHSKREMNEDRVFVLIIETLLVIVAVLSGTVITFFEEFLQMNVLGRHMELFDVFSSILGLLLAAIIVYSTPIVGEMEIALKHIFFDTRSKKHGIK